MKKLINFQEFILEKTTKLNNNTPTFKTSEQQVGDTVIIQGKPVEITEITKTIKDSVLSFKGRINGKHCSVTYDDGLDGYNILNNESYFVGVGGDLEGLAKKLKNKIGHDYEIKNNKLYFFASEDEETEKELKNIAKDFGTKISLE